MRKDWLTMDRASKIDEVFKLANKGFSASKIAAEYANASRNAIIGFCHRHNIGLGASATEKKPTQRPNYNYVRSGRPVGRPPKPKPAPNPVEEESKTVSEVVVEEAIAPPPPPPPVVEAASVKEREVSEIVFGPVSMVELSLGRCKWPLLPSYRGLSAEEMMFCGSSTENHSFCKAHQKIAYEAAWSRAR